MGAVGEGCCVSMCNARLVAMTALPKHKMTVDEYLAWAQGRPGRFELYAGTVYAMTPERAGDDRGIVPGVNAIAGADRTICVADTLRWNARPAGRGALTRHSGWDRSRRIGAKAA